MKKYERILIDGYKELSKAIAKGVSKEDIITISDYVNYHYWPLFTLSELAECLPITKNTARNWIDYWLYQGYVYIHTPGKGNKPTLYSWDDDLEELLEIEEVLDSEC